MTELAYMVREDWAQNGTTMIPKSTVIRDWIGGTPYLFAVADAVKFQTHREADLEAAKFIAPVASSRKVFNIGELAALPRQDKALDHAIVVLHPRAESDMEALANAVEHTLVSRVFVLVWSPNEIVRMWLDGHSAIDLHTGEARDAPDPILAAAAEWIVDEEYNGLSSGRGKDAVVQLVRVFAAEGYPIEADMWLRAYFAAGGSFRHSEEIAKLIGEVKRGTKHRVQTRYGDNIFAVLRDRVASTV
jgi:hypothetical protein